MMPSNIAARMTLAADPGSLHGALAAGILGGGPVILGTAEECARLLEQAQERVAAGGAPAVVAEELAQAIHAAGGKLPGFGHPVHKPLDPRAERILELATRAAWLGRTSCSRASFRDAVAEGVGQAAHAERLDADRRGDARPRVLRRPPSRPFLCSRARRACSPTSSKSRKTPSDSSSRRAPRRRSSTTAARRD